MARHSFSCIDAHTCGNPVWVVTSGGPPLPGPSMMDRRRQFLAEYDWIRTGLMFEPRGHDMMSGSILYPAADPANDAGILFIETSGCLPMCGHGTIGTVRDGRAEPGHAEGTPGVLRLEVPAGLVESRYTMAGSRVASVRIVNVPSFLHARGLAAECPDLGTLTVDVAYGGNFYAIVDPQPNYPGLERVSAGDILRWSPVVGRRLNEAHTFVHPADPRIRGLSHVQWTGAPQLPGSP